MPFFYRNFYHKFHMYTYHAQKFLGVWSSFLLRETEHCICHIWISFQFWITLFSHTCLVQYACQATADLIVSFRSWNILLILELSIVILILWVRPFFAFLAFFKVAATKYPKFLQLLHFYSKIIITWNEKYYWIIPNLTFFVGHEF